MAEEDSFYEAEANPFAVGQTVMAQYMEDSEWYVAEIIEHDEAEEVFVVVFTEYGNEQECTAEMMQHIKKKSAADAEFDAAAARKKQATEALEDDDTEELSRLEAKKADNKSAATKKEAAAKAAAAAKKAEDDKKVKAQPPKKSAVAKVEDPFGDEEAEERPKKVELAKAAKKSPEPVKKQLEVTKKSPEVAKKADKAASGPVAKKPPAKKVPVMDEDAADELPANSKKSPEPKAKSGGSGGGRREMAEKRRKQGMGKKATLAYDDNDSVLHGVDNIDEIIATAESELFASLDKLERAKSGQDLVSLASTLGELAVLPCTPQQDVEEYWTKALAAAARALQVESKSTAILTQAAHLYLRRGLYLVAGSEMEGAEAAFEEAATKYRNVFDLAPVRIVLKYIVLALSCAPSLNLQHFLGLFDNGYSKALMRHKEEMDFNQAIQHHLSKLSELSFAGVAYPLFRAHCFGILRMAVIGMAIAVTEDLPEDQAALLLNAWDAVSRLEKTDEASLLGFYLLKLFDDAADLAVLADAAPKIREFIVQVNYAKLADTIADAGEDELQEMANAELEEVLAGMSEYDPNEVLKSMRNMQSDLLRLEVKRAGPVVSMALRDVDLEDLFAVAGDRFELSQFFAARMYAGLLLEKNNLAKVTQALCAEFNGPRILAFLCISENPETAKVAAEALAVLAENAKNKSALERTGVVEAAVYLLSNANLAVVGRAVAALASLVSDPACADAMKRVRKQLGPALLDQVFCSDADLVKAIAALVVELFGVTDKDSAVDCTTEMIPDVIQEDLDDIVDVLLRELPKKAAVAAKAVSAKPPAKAVPAAAAQLIAVAARAPAPAVLEKGKSEKEVVRGRGFTQKLEAQYSSADFGLLAPPSEIEGEGDEVNLDPEAQDELERELAGMDDFDESSLSQQSQIEAREMEEKGEDIRVVNLLKLGAALEEQVATKLDEGDVDAAEDLIDMAIVKYKLLQRLSPTSHVCLRRLADALLRKAEFRDGSFADDLYAEAIELYDKDIAVHDVEESYSHKVQAMIDRAKNKAAEEEPKGVFTVTRKLLAEAKQAAAHVKERDGYIAAINEVLTYCRLQTDAKKATTKPSSPRGGGNNNNNNNNTSGGIAPVPKAVAAAVEPKPKSATSSPSPAPKKPAASGTSAGLSAKPTATNPDAIVRKGSMLVAQKKAGTSASAPTKTGLTASLPGGLPKKAGQAVGEKERLQSALAAKKPVSKVGKLNKEGGGKSLLGRKTWKERLFELSESSLEYYEKSNKTEKPKGAISLYEVTTARSVTVPNKSYCFEVVTEGRKFPIQAQSDADKEEWIKAIIWNVDRLKLAKKIKMLG